MAAERYYVTVLLPIEVAEGGYCWEQGRRVCEHFDNEGGSSRCTLGLGQMREDKDFNYPKPDACRALKEVE